MIATAYTGHVALPALATAIGLFGLLLTLRFAPVGRGPASVAVAGAMWVAMLKSGIDPIIVGLAFGLVTSAYPPSREDLERATALTRSFREQPTPELARSAQLGVLSAISLNERLQYSLHPWSSYVVVPLFALANAGIHVNGRLLEGAVSSPITLGIVLGYVLGKPAGILAATWLASLPWLRGMLPPLSLASLVGGGAVAGIGFTVSLLICTKAFGGERLAQAKLGVLASAVIAPAVAWLLFALYRRLPQPLLARQLQQTAGDILDLSDDVDLVHDHIRGPVDATVTLLEYGDFECPYCGRAEPVIRELLADFGDDLRYVWRHLPLNDVHLHAQLAAEAAEAADAQGHFWEMYDAMHSREGALTAQELGRIAAQIGLDVERFWGELRAREHAERVAEDVTSADTSGVSGTPTFFINGRRHYGAYDIDTLTDAVRAARRRAQAVGMSLASSAAS